LFQLVSHTRNCSHRFISYFRWNKKLHWRSRTRN